MQPTLMDRALPLLRTMANLTQRVLLPLGLRMSRTVNGHKVRFDPGTDIGMHLLLTGRFEPQAIARCAEYVRPDDVVLEGVLRKFFSERNIRPHDDVYPYLLRRMERSIPGAEEIVRRLDETEDGMMRPVSRVLAREILEDDIENLDLFEG